MTLCSSSLAASRRSSFVLCGSSLQTLCLDVFGWLVRLVSIQACWWSGIRLDWSNLRHRIEMKAVSLVHTKCLIVRGSFKECLLPIGAAWPSIFRRPVHLPKQTQRRLTHFLFCQALLMFTTLKLTLEASGNYWISCVTEILTPIQGRRRTSQSLATIQTIMR